MVIGRRHQEGQRHLESIGDLARVERELECRLHQGDDRRDIETADGAVFGQLADDIDVPALIGVGTKDDIAGSPQALAALMPHATALDIPGRDHMLAVGDRVFKKAALEFLEAYGHG